MSAAERDCAACGHTNSGDAMFCSKCGARIPPASEPPDVAVAASESEPPVAPSEPPVAPSEPPAAAVAPSEPPAAAIAPSTPPPSSAPPAKPKRRVAGSAKTMMGMPSPEQAAMVEAAREAAKEKAAARREERARRDEAASAPAKPLKKPERRIPGTARTMLGMASPDPGAVEAAIADARQKQADHEQAEKKDAAGADDAARTIEDEVPPAAKRSPARALDPTTNRTMLGQPAPRADADEPDAQPPRTSEPPSRARSEVMYPTDTGEEEAFILPQRRIPKGVAVGVLVLGVIILFVGGGALVWSLLQGGSGLRATVVQGDEGEMLEIEVPGAEAGTRVRFRGAEEELSAGRARFPLAADDLRLGDNELSVDVVAPDGSASTDTVALHLEMRVRADVGPLMSAGGGAATPPAIDVVVEAPPGSEVTLDGAALELDARGRGTRRVPIESAGASAEGVVEHVVRYRVSPPSGETAQGELRTRIPLTTMQIDRPGTEVVTDASEIHVAGAVAPGSTVTVDGTEVEVRMGRFLHTLPLSALGERTVEVIARAPGKAPRLERIVIRRVEDLATEAASFDANEELTYARIAQNPTTYRGQRVAFEGVVYNVDVREGRSVLQVLVDDCPSGERCPLWVTYPAATEAELRARIRVLGTVAGEQQFRSQSGAIRTVPRVDATYVLPATR